MGLGQPPTEGMDTIERAISLKMSKSKPETAIFMTDSEEEIQQKMHKAYCPEKQVEENPVLDYAKYLVFETQKELRIERPKKFGGDLTLASYQELADQYRKGALHPLDLKKAVADSINTMVDPVRNHFKKGKAKQLADQIAAFEVTR